MKRMVLAIISWVGAVALATPASAQEVLAGFDLLETGPGAEVDLGGPQLALLCGLDFEVTGNGGVVALEGVPLTGSNCCPGLPLHDADTIVERLEDTTGFPPGGPGVATDPVPIQICALHLRSIAPFEVTNTNTGGIEMWTVEIDLDPITVQPIGQMTITRQNATGGTFQTDALPVIPRFTFKNASDIQVCQAEGPPVQLSSGVTVWSYTPAVGTPAVDGCTTNFFPDLVQEEKGGAFHPAGAPPCSCEAVLLERIVLTPTRHKYIIGALTDCDVINDFHMKIVQPADAAIVGCSVDPFSSWYCDVISDTEVYWETQTNPIQPGDPLPVFDVVVEKTSGGIDVFEITFTRDGLSRCETTFMVENPISIESSTWGQIKSRYWSNEE